MSHQMVGMAPGIAVKPPTCGLADQLSASSRLSAKDFPSVEVQMQGG
jgi:hypothetical protein